MNTQTSFEEVHSGIKGGYFTPPKPKNEQDENDKKIIAGLESTGALMIQRKHDGNGHIATIGKKKSEVDIYTLGLNPVLSKYPHLLKDISAACFPPNTVLCTEIICTVDGTHNRYEATRLTSSGEQKAREYQEQSGIYPSLSIFNALVWDNEDVTGWSNHDRHHCILEHMKKKKRADHVQMIDLIEMSLEEARALAAQSSWEGLVLYDKNAFTKIAMGKPGGKMPSIPRPYGAWKDKVGLEVDFVAYDFVPSTAEAHAGGVKDFYIGLHDPETGKIIPCGKCGNGLSRDDRFKFAKPGALPVAVEVGFEQWSKHGKTLLGKINRVRDPKDKSHLQCVATETQLETVLTSKRIDPKWS